MNNFPMYQHDPIVGKIEHIETQSEIFSNVCDEVRWLMLDWMEYQDKQGIAISHNVYLDMWNDTFNRVWAKRENT